MAYTRTPGRSPFLKTGNGIPSALLQTEETAATRQDSLLVQGQGRKQMEYYTKMGYTPHKSTNPDQKPILNREDLKVSTNRKNEQLKHGDLTTVIETNPLTGDVKRNRREYNPKKENYSTDINKYQFQHNEGANFIINKNAPQSITDTRIKPLGTSTMIGAKGTPYEGDVVNFNNYQDLKVSAPPASKTPPTTKTPPISKTPPVKTDVKPTVTKADVKPTAVKKKFNASTGSEAVETDVIRDNTRIGTSFGTTGMKNQIETKFKRQSDPTNSGVFQLKSKNKKK